MKAALTAEPLEVKTKERWALRQARDVQARVRAKVAEALAGPPMPTRRSMPDASARELLEAKLAHPAAKPIAKHLLRFIDAASASELFDAHARWEVLGNGEGQWRRDGGPTPPERLHAFMNDLLHRTRSNPLWLPEIEPALDNLVASNAAAVREVGRGRAGDQQVAQECVRDDLWEGTRAALEEFVFERVPTLSLRHVSKTRRADEQLHGRLAELAFLRPEHLEIKPLLKAMEVAASKRASEGKLVPDDKALSPEALWGAAAVHLWRMADDSATPSPSSKLHEVVAAAGEVTRTLSRFLDGEPPGADDQLPALMLAILHANPPRLRSAMWAVSEYAPNATTGPGSYHLVSLCSAVAWLTSGRPEGVHMPEGVTFEAEAAKSRAVLAERIQAEIDAEDGRLAYELDVMKSQAYAKGLLVVRDHLDKFLAASPSTATYEEWIFALHPENTQEKAGSSWPGRCEVDHRFYLPGADHLVLWNGHARTESRRVRGSHDFNEEGSGVAERKAAGGGERVEEKGGGGGGGGGGRRSGGRGTKMDLRRVVFQVSFQTGPLGLLMSAMDPRTGALLTEPQGAVAGTVHPGQATALAVVSAVSQGGAAIRCGIQRADVILAVGDAAKPGTLMTYNQVVESIAALPRPVRVVLQRLNDGGVTGFSGGEAARNLPPDDPQFQAHVSELRHLASTGPLSAAGLLRVRFEAGPLGLRLSALSSSTGALLAALDGGGSFHPEQATALAAVSAVTPGSVAAAAGVKVGDVVVVVACGVVGNSEDAFGQELQGAAPVYERVLELIATLPRPLLLTVQRLSGHNAAAAFKTFEQESENPLLAAAAAPPPPTSPPPPPPPRSRRLPPPTSPTGSFVGDGNTAAEGSSAAAVFAAPPGVRRSLSAKLLGATGPGLRLFQAVAQARVQTARGRGGSSSGGKSSPESGRGFLGGMDDGAEFSDGPSAEAQQGVGGSNLPIGELP
jgi:uncharacterized membrane protein YgcG